MRQAAQFVSQSVPAEMTAGHSYTVSVVLKNIGTATWRTSDAYALGSQNPQDNDRWGMGRVALPDDITPGKQATFTFNVRAPSVAGSYGFQWRMVQDGVAWFGATTSNQQVTVTAAPERDATFIEQSVPSSVQAGASFRVTLKIKNTGTATWRASESYWLGSQSPQDTSRWGKSRVPVPNDVAPGGEVTFTFSAQAPTVAGNYDFQWRMLQDGVAWFGDMTRLQTIQVASTSSSTPTAPSTPIPTSSSYSQTEEITYYDDLSKWVLGQVSKSVVGGVAVSETAYGANAQPLTVKSYGKLQQTLTYNPDGTVATIKDGNNNVTTYANWKRGIPLSIKYADGKTQTATVDVNGWLTSVTDENGYTTSYGYDAMGRLARIAYPSGDSPAWNVTTQVFEPVNAVEYGIAAGHWRQTVSTGNSRKLTYYDALWRPLLTREYDVGNAASTQRFQRFAYDQEGRTTFASYPGSSAALSTGIWTEYDPLGRVVSSSRDSELGLLTTLTEYQSGLKTRVTDPKGNQTTTSYMAYDEPKYDWPVQIAHPNGAYTHIPRDVFGKPLQIRRGSNPGAKDDGAGVNRDFAYNSYQELCRVVEPESGATLYGYDGAGNLKWSSSGLPGNNVCAPTGTVAAVAARRVDRTYDARNRLKTLTFPDGRGNQTWAYTPDGLVASVTTYNDVKNGQPVINSYSYNKRRLMTAESSAQPGWYNWKLAYGYDANGNLSSQSYPDGLSVAYAPNALGQPTRAGVYATGVSYYPNGAIKQFTYGNGIVHTMGQNARQLPSASVDCTAGGACATANRRLSLAYKYDANGNVTNITDGVNGRQTRGMVYDGLDRLAQVTSNMFGTASYSYDVMDNLTHVRITGGQARDQYYCYDKAWRLANIKTSSCSGTTVVGLGYDVQGNLANKNGQKYTFDYGNRLRDVTGKESYRYDGLGRRVLASSATLGNIVSLYTKAGQLWYQNDQRRGANLNYIYLGGSLVATREMVGSAQTVKYQHTDALGTPIAVTGANKALIQTSEYEPYGQLLNRTLTDGPGFTGHVQDALTGLTYMQQRYYDQGIGRFLSTDPVTAYAKPGVNFNRYWYAFNNPYKFTDPDGRQSCLWGYCDSGTASDQPRNPQQARMQGVREAGAVGERLNGINPGDPRERVQSRTGTAAYRVVDKSSKTEIREVKNVGRLDRITNQMKDLVAEAKASARDLVYSVRENTTIGKAVSEFFGANGVTVDRNLPTLENQPTLRQLETMPARGAVPEPVPMPMVRPVVDPIIIP